MKTHTIQLIEGQVVTSGANIVFYDGDSFRVKFQGTAWPIMVVVGESMGDDPEASVDHYQTDADDAVEFSGGIDALPEGETVYWTAKEYRGADQTTVAIGTFTKIPANRSRQAPVLGVGTMKIGSSFQVA